jgi:alkylation response protein AidB-like acyl-CoA dehydrogenase
LKLNVEPKQLLYGQLKKGFNGGKMVDFEFTEEQELFRKAVREWCEKNLPIEKIREMDTKGAIPQELLKSMGEMGSNIITAPQEHGGTGADWVTACIAAEELGYADVSIALVARALFLCWRDR